MRLTQGNLVLVLGRGGLCGAYRCMGTSDVKCTEDDLLVLYQNREVESYDLTPVNDATSNRSQKP